MSRAHSPASSLPHCLQAVVACWTRFHPRGRRSSSFAPWFPIHSQCLQRMWGWQRRRCQKFILGVSVEKLVSCIASGHRTLLCTFTHPHQTHHPFLTFPWKPRVPSFSASSLPLVLEVSLSHSLSSHSCHKKTPTATATRLHRRSR
jgi:hypothetical protein